MQAIVKARIQAKQEQSNYNPIVSQPVGIYAKLNQSINNKLDLSR